MRVRCLRERWQCLLRVQVKERRRHRIIYLTHWLMCLQVFSFLEVLSRLLVVVSVFGDQARAQVSNSLLHMRAHCLPKSGHAETPSMTVLPPSLNVEKRFSSFLPFLPFLGFFVCFFCTRSCAMDRLRVATAIFTTHIHNHSVMLSYCQSGLSVATQNRATTPLTETDGELLPRLFRGHL